MARLLKYLPRQKKLLLFSLLILVSCLINPTPSWAKTIGLQIGNTGVIIDDTRYKLDVAPYTKSSRAMVPLRFISETLGAKVSAYNVESGVQARIELRHVQVLLTEGCKDSRFVNEYGSDQVVNMDVAPEIKDGRMFVPIGFIAKNFGCNIYWDPEWQIILIEQNS